MMYIGNQTAKLHIIARENIHVCVLFRTRNLSRYVWHLTVALAACLLLNGCIWFNSCNLAPPITGRILDKASEKGIAGACITYKTNYAPYLKTAVTDKDGCFELGSITSRHVIIILPFFFIEIPFTEYHADKTENPACHIKIEKSGYIPFSMLLESQYVNEHRKLSLYRHNITLDRLACSSEEKPVMAKNKKELFDNIYSDIFLFNENNVRIYLRQISTDNPK